MARSKNKPKKKSKSGVGNRSRETLRVVLPVKTYKLLIKYCKKNRITVSRVGRKAISRYLNNWN